MSALSNMVQFFGVALRVYDRPMRAILHVDMDAFFAAIEQHDHPELRGQPVIVAGPGRRSVVLTASYEARPFGVHSAMPTAQARRLCPHGLYVAPHFARYAAVSAQVFAVFAEATPLIEGLSLDEAFLDVSASLGLFGDIKAVGRHVKQRIRERTGLAASIGMAHNKLLAKLASELSKPDGLLRIAPDEVQATLDPLPVGRLWGVGRVAQQRLERCDIRSIGQLRLADPARLSRALGRNAAGLQRLACGADDRPVEPEREEKSIGAETTFDVDLDTFEDADAWLLRLSERVSERARRRRLRGRVVHVKLREPPFITHTRQARLPAPSDATAAIHGLARDLLVRWWRQRNGRRLRLLGISLGGFEEEAQADMFTAGSDGVDALQDSVNRRFGEGSLTRGATLRTRGRT